MGLRFALTVDLLPSPTAGGLHGSAARQRNGRRVGTLRRGRQGLLRGAQLHVSREGSRVGPGRVHGWF